MNLPTEEEPRVCKHCGRILQPSRGSKPREYCSQSCRQMHYIKSLQQARDLVRQQGGQPDQKGESNVP